jgi:hypothetical protein
MVYAVKQADLFIGRSAVGDGRLFGRSQLARPTHRVSPRSRRGELVCGPLVRLGTTLTGKEPVKLSPSIISPPLGSGFRIRSGTCGTCYRI